MLVQHYVVHSCAQLATDGAMLSVITSLISSGSRGGDDRPARRAAWARAGGQRRRAAQRREECRLRGRLHGRPVLGWRDIAHTTLS
jgi:hypothetical protein